MLRKSIKKMNWDDTGYLISKNRYNENSIIAEIFTESHGKVSGIIFGGTSKKVKNYLQIGNKLYVNYNSKNVSRMGYFKIEILQALTPLVEAEQWQEALFYTINIRKKLLPLCIRTMQSWKVLLSLKKQLLSQWTKILLNNQN